MSRPRGPKSISAFAVRTRDCFQDPDDASVSEVTVVRCALPHDNEAFHTFDLPDGAFDADHIEQAATIRCKGAFPAYVGIPYQDSALFVDWMKPSARSWEHGDRRVICILYGDTPTTGSAWKTRK